MLARYVEYRKIKESNNKWRNKSIIYNDTFFDPRRIRKRKRKNERNKAHGHATTGSSENFCVHDPKDDVAENNNNEESNDQKSTDGDDPAQRVIWDGPPVEVPLDMLFGPKVHYTSSQFLIVV